VPNVYLQGKLLSVKKTEQDRKAEYRVLREAQEKLRERDYEGEDRKA